MKRVVVVLLAPFLLSAGCAGNSSEPCRHQDPGPARPSAQQSGPIAAPIRNGTLRVASVDVFVDTSKTFVRRCGAKACYGMPPTHIFGGCDVRRGACYARAFLEGDGRTADYLFYWTHLRGGGTLPQRITATLNSGRFRVERSKVVIEGGLTLPRGADFHGSLGDVATAPSATFLVDGINGTVVSASPAFCA